MVNASNKLYNFSYGTHIIKFKLTYAERKTLGISILPNQSVLVNAPLGKSVGDIINRVKKHSAWILRQIDYFESFQPLQPPRKFVSGETHPFLGRLYRLKVIKSKNESVKLVGRFLCVRTKNKDNRRKIKFLVEDWYQLHAQAILERRFSGCLKVAEFHGISEPKTRYRKMLRRWGSCDKNNTITLNTELVKAPISCIDYVICHELCHIRYKNHSAAFFRLLITIMPDWEERKKRLFKVTI